MMKFFCICDHRFEACDHISKTTKITRFALCGLSVILLFGLTSRAFQKLEVPDLPLRFILERGVGCVCM
ncbi:hypothetical protein TW79_14845 [Tritonibacter mobilis]|uniref:Uncharacterized protein n=1 Tax=Tritonibacter mobilis F1926 TaxID=1265309 RepID=A0A1B1A9D9_9RHOB|nr:hypothetical protein K529_020720 [Tritonibacter mobilis F1926]KJZ23063.1 hypothetical protein TW79_14845 [Tritonibacter mobilis]